MDELVEKIEDARPPRGVSSQWLIGGVDRELVLKEAAEGDRVLKRLRLVLNDMFQAKSQNDYESAASERERALNAGYRKALKDIYRLLQLDI